MSLILRLRSIIFIAVNKQLKGFTIMILVAPAGLTERLSLKILRFSQFLVDDIVIPPAKEYQWF